MGIDIEIVDPAELADFRAVIEHASLAYEFDSLLAAGSLEHKMEDALRAHAATLLARVDGTPAGACLGFALPQAGEAAMLALRMGVIAPYRRRGVGTALLARAREAARAHTADGGVGTLGASAWQPVQGAPEFVARHGFQHARYFWRMEREAHPTPVPIWPDGITWRTFDGSDAMLGDWTDVYNASFAEHYRFIPGTRENGRHIVSAADYEAGSLIIAYRAQHPVGFCRNERLGDTGMIGVLGTDPAERGIGLGRALLRWSVAFHQSRGRPRCCLFVDGENERAQNLYKDEHFDVTRTRQIWERAL